MPRRGHVIPVACGACRARKAKCDGATPTCSPCRAKGTKCAYGSDPHIPRPVALRSEYERLKSGYENFLVLYNRLKFGSEAEIASLVWRIQSSQQIVDMSDDPSKVRAFSSPEESMHSASTLRDDYENRTTTLPRTLTPLAIASLENSSTTQVLDHEVQDNYDLSFKRREGNSSSGPSRILSRSMISVSHRVLLWPVIRCTIVQAEVADIVSDLEGIVTYGSTWLLRKEMLKSPANLPSAIRLTCLSFESGFAIFPDLSAQKVHEYTAAYFNTYNVLIPLLDMATFVEDVADKLLRRGYADNDPDSVLALLVFALGQLATDGVACQPNYGDTKELSGFRGGTIQRPPGLDLFNEARRRIGTTDMQCCLEHVQILLLQATYFEASARHAEFWSLTSAASMACIFLIRGEAIDWSSPYGDLVKRAYWICVLHERLFDLDLRVAAAGIEGLQDTVPLPHFDHRTMRYGQESAERNLAGGQNEKEKGGGTGETWEEEKDHRTGDRSFRGDDYAYEFIALVTLSRIMRRADDLIHGHECSEGGLERLWPKMCMEVDDDAVRGVTGVTDRKPRSEPSSALVQEMLRQLQEWRDALPTRLQWSDNDKFGFPDYEMTGEIPSTSYFSTLLNTGPGKLDHNVDIAVAQLRTRFYHARFLICRPFVYKALHTPGSMTMYDRTKCAAALDAACLWPLSLAPPKNKKHLVPHLFSWTQNFLAMSLILHVAYQNPLLKDICEENNIAEEDIETSIDSMMAWFRDMKKVDGVAAWSLAVLEPLISCGDEKGSKP